METVAFPCPHCTVRIKAPAQAFGKTLKCPKCLHPILVPSPEPPAAPLPQVKRDAVSAHLPPPVPTQHAADDIEMLREELRELRRSATRREVVYVQTPQLIEQTSKGWKAIQLLGGLVGSFTLFLICAGAGTNHQNKDAAAVLVFVSLAGWLTYLYGKIGAWWNHG